MVTFTYKWFVIFYFAISTLSVVFGLIWLINPGKITLQTQKALGEKPPKRILQLLKYLLIFDILNLVFAFFPFRWIHIGYVIWVFIAVYVVGRFMLNWSAFSEYWLKHQDKLPTFFRRLGAVLLVVGVSTYLILYLII